MNTATANPVTEIPNTLKKWIADFCAGKEFVNVGHRMFSVKENLTNVSLEHALNLIRTDRDVEAYIAKDKVRMAQVAAYTASCVSEQVLKKFSSARYPGD